MKRAKKIFLCALTALALSAAFAQESDSPKFSFQNKMKTYTLRAMDDDVDGGNFYDQMKATFSAKRLFAMIKARTILSYTGRDDGDNPYSIGRPNGLTFKRGNFDWTIKFMPIAPLGISLHETIWIPGTYLVVEDDNLQGGNIGSHGLTVSFTGIPGLTLALSAPYDFHNDPDDSGDSWGRIVGKNKFDCDGDYIFRLGAGAIYEYEKLFSVGAAFHEIGLSEFGLGAYATLSPVKSLTLYAGYTYNGGYSLYVDGEHIINASAVFKPGIMDFGVDWLTNTDGDFYAALRVGCDVTEKIYVKVEGLAQTSYSGADEGKFRVYPEVTFKFKKMGTLSAGMELWFDGGDFAYVEFPITWIYSFKG